MIKNDSRARTPDSSSCIICFRKLGICLVYVMPPTFLLSFPFRKLANVRASCPSLACPVPVHIHRTWAFPCTRHSFTEHQHAKGSFTEHQHANSQTVMCGSLHTSHTPQRAQNTKNTRTRSRGRFPSHLAHVTLASFSRQKSEVCSESPHLFHMRLLRKPGSLVHDKSQPSASSSESEYATNRKPSLRPPSSLLPAALRSRFLLDALRLGDPSTTLASVATASVATAFVASDATGGAATHTSATGAFCRTATWF